MAYYGLGYSIIGHLSNYKLIAKMIPNIHERNKGKICVSLQCGKGAQKKHEFTDACKKYLDIHSKEIMKQDILSLPYARETFSHRKSTLDSPLVTILKTMKIWCNKNHKMGNMKGFVIYDQNSELPIDIFQNDQNRAVAERCLHETIIAYNPMENVIFLIRRAKDKNLLNEMKLSTNDIINFLLLYNDVLTKSGVKLINLLVTDDKFDDLMCEPCKHQVISMKSFSSPASLQKWWEQKKRKFKISFIHKQINKNFPSDFFAKSFGFFAMYHEDPVRQLTERILLTPEQIRIIYSSHKHLIIKGCYGSGKSTVGRIKAEMISRELKEKEALYYVLYDSRSEHVAEIMFQNEHVSKMHVFFNKYGMKLKNIIDEILKENRSKQKINLIVDGFVSEDLDETETVKVNEALTKNEKLKDSTIFLIFQPLEKEMIKSSTGEKRDMGSLLKSMELKTLTYNMRTTVEINSLVRATIDALNDQFTVFQTYHPNTEKSKNQIYLTNTLEHKESMQDAGNQVILTGQEINKERIEDIGKAAKFSIKKESCLEKPPITTEIIKIEEAGDNKKDWQGKYDEAIGKVAKFSIKKESCLETPSVTTEIIKIEEAGDVKKGWQDKYDDGRTITPDKASEYFMFTSGKSSTSNIVTRKYQHFESNKSGNNIHSEVPSLYEICYPEESAEFKMHLIIILCKVMNEKVEFLTNEMLRFDDLTGTFNIKKHVILHFNTENDIPDPFDSIFRLMGISENVTVKYEEFSREKEKKVLICSFRTFRGLEYPRVIVAVDDSVCFSKHFLPELLTRSTSALHIIAFKERNHLEKVIGNWKAPVRGPPLIKQWEIEIVDPEKKVPQISTSAESRHSEKISIRICSNVYEELEKKVGIYSATKKEIINQSLHHVR